MPGSTCSSSPPPRRRSQSGSSTCFRPNEGRKGGEGQTGLLGGSVEAGSRQSPGSEDKAKIILKTLANFLSFFSPRGLKLPN